MSVLNLTPDELVLIMNKRKTKVVEATQKRIEDEKYAEFTTNVLPTILPIVSDYQKQIETLKHTISATQLLLDKVNIDYTQYKRGIRQSGQCLHKHHENEHVYCYDEDTQRRPMYGFNCPYCDTLVSCTKDGQPITFKK